jgi:hypothetical protein
MLDRKHGRYPQQQEWEHRAPGRPTTSHDQAALGLGRADEGAGRRRCAQPSTPPSSTTTAGRRFICSWGWRLGLTLSC